MPCVNIALLGRFEVRLDDQRVDAFGYDKVRALLAYLACEADHIVSREFLAGLLWPDYPEQRARQNLSQALFTLRKAMADDRDSPSFLHVTRRSVQFTCTDCCRLDVGGFESLLAACRTHAHRDLQSCGACVERLSEAALLYRGDFLGAFSLPDSPLFEEWVLVQRERLNHKVMQALEELAGAYMARGEFGRALEYARRQLVLNPWRESAHRQVIRALALSGQRQEALAQYETCCAILMEDLGVKPEPETVALCQEIRAGRLSVRVGTSAEPPEAGVREDEMQDAVISRGPLHNLPVQLSPFVGRASELDALCRTLQDPACRLLSLVGPGGSGKTRLALEGAKLQLSHFQHGVYLVPLAALDSREGVVPKIAESIGLVLRATNSVETQLADYLRQKNMLLILDSFEQALDGLDVVLSLLQAAPDLKIVLTSRVRTNAQGEMLFFVAGLTAWNGATRDADPHHSDAVKLFATGAKRNDPAFELAPANVGSVRQICSLVRGMPLAILLAASWVPILSTAEIADHLVDELESNVDFLRADWQDVPARQRSLRAVLDHTWRLLTIREQAVVQALSVFRGGFTYTTARQVVGITLWELRALVNKSFVCCPVDGRYEIHELTRQYVARKLSQAPEAHRAVCAQHSAVYIKLLRSWAMGLRGAEQQAVLAKMRYEVENARLAWLWALESNMDEGLSPAFQGLCLFYELRVRYEEGLSLCRATVAAGDASDIGVSLPLLRSCALTWWARLERLLGHTDVARSLLEGALASVASAAEPDCDPCTVHAFILLQLGEIAIVSDRDRALDHNRTALALYREAGDDWGAANALSAMAFVAHQTSRYDQASAWNQEALDLRIDLGDRRGIADTYIWLGYNSLRRGSVEEGVALIRRGTSIRRETGDKGGVALATYQLGTALIWAGELEQSLTLLEQSVELYQDLGIGYDLAYSTIFLGSVKGFLGDCDGAIATLSTGLQLARDMGFQRETNFALFGLGGVALMQGSYVEAERFLCESIAGYRALGQRDEMSWSLAMSAYVSRFQGATAPAWANLREALEIGVELHTFMTVVYGLPILALLLCDQGDVATAVEVQAMLWQFPLVRNARWFDDVAFQHIRAAAEAIDPEVIEASRKRGEHRDPYVAAADFLEDLPMFGDAVVQPSVHH